MNAISDLLNFIGYAALTISGVFVIITTFLYVLYLIEYDKHDKNPGNKKVGINGLAGLLLFVSGAPLFVSGLMFLADFLLPILNSQFLSRIDLHLSEIEYRFGPITLGPNWPIEIMAMLIGMVIAFLIFGFLTDLVADSQFRRNIIVIVRRTILRIHRMSPNRRTGVQEGFHRLSIVLGSFGAIGAAIIGILLYSSLQW